MIKTSESDAIPSSDRHETLKERARAAFTKYPTRRECQTALDSGELGDKERKIIEYVLRKFDLRKTLATRSDDQHGMSVGAIGSIAKYLESFSPAGVETDESRRERLKHLGSEMETMPRASQGAFQIAHQKTIPEALQGFSEEIRRNLKMLEALSEQQPEESPINMFPRDGRSIREMLRDFYEGAEEGSEERDLRPTTTERMIGTYYAAKKARLASGNKASKMLPSEDSTADEAETVSPEAFYHTREYRDLRVQYNKIREWAKKNRPLSTFLESLFAEIPTLEKEERENRMEVMKKLVQIAQQPQAALSSHHGQYMTQALGRERETYFYRGDQAKKVAIDFFKGTTTDPESKQKSEAFYQYQRYLVSLLQNGDDLRSAMPSLAMLSLWRKNKLEDLGMTDDGAMQQMTWSESGHFLNGARLKGASIEMSNTGIAINEELTKALQDEMNLMAAELLDVLNCRAGTLKAEGRSLDRMPIVDSELELRGTIPRGEVETTREGCEPLNAIGRMVFDETFRSETQKREEMEGIIKKLKGEGTNSDIDCGSITGEDIERIPLIPLNDAIVRRLTENKTRLSELLRKESLFTINRSLAIRIIMDFISSFNGLIQRLEQKINELENTPKGLFTSKSDKQKAQDLEKEIKDLRQMGRGKISSAKETITEYLGGLDFPETSSLRKKCEGIQVGSESELPSPVEELKSIEDELKICFSPFIEERKSISAESVRLFEILQAVEREISGSISEYRELLGNTSSSITFERQTLDNEERNELIDMRRRTKN